MDCLTGSIVYAMVKWLNMTMHTSCPCCNSCKSYFSTGILLCSSSFLVVYALLLTVIVKIHTLSTPHNKN